MNEASSTALGFILISLIMLLFVAVTDKLGGCEYSLVAGFVLCIIVDSLDKYFFKKTQS